MTHKEEFQALMNLETPMRKVKQQLTQHGVELAEKMMKMQGEMAVACAQLGLPLDVLDPEVRQSLGEQFDLSGVAPV